MSSVWFFGCGLRGPVVVQSSVGVKDVSGTASIGFGGRFALSCA